MQLCSYADFDNFLATKNKLRFLSIMLIYCPWSGVKSPTLTKTMVQEKYHERKFRKETEK